MIKGIEDVDKIRHEVQFPAMVKPIHSYKFLRVFGRKLFIVDSSFEELRSKAADALAQGLEIMIVEMIPGPDALLCSQFSYIDGNDNQLYNYTKRVIRRYPVNSGTACYHITEWIPEVNELARTFLAAIKFRGLANPEFKRDLRDGKLKLIEVNVRFTAVHELLVRSGLPLDIMVYRHLTGQSVPRISGYAQFMRMWEPVRDFLAYRQLSKRGELTLLAWIRSVIPYKKITPVFRLSDPWPSLVSTALQLRKIGKI
jgi:predicted ATP-grasp superfamily ATP-dependent carboligase